MKFTKREISTGTGSNNYLRLKDGENKIGVPRGEIYEFRTKWVSGKSIVVPDSDHEGKSRFRLNFVIFEEGQFKPLIWEFGVTIYNQLADIADVYELDKTKLRVSRSGSTKDNTSYNILPILKEPLSEKAIQAIAAVPLNILSHQQSSPPAASGGPDSFGPPPIEDDLDNIPF